MRVLAVNAYGRSTWSNTVTTPNPVADPPSAAPAIPSGITLGGRGCSNLGCGTELYFTEPAITNPTYYEFGFSVDGGQTWNYSQLTQNQDDRTRWSTTEVLTNFDPTMLMVVRSVNRFGSSANSATFHF